jgi:hypothetical protein
MEEQSARIKQLTIKGLEPEIQRLVEQQKLEIKRLKELQVCNTSDSILALLWILPRE